MHLRAQTQAPIQTDEDVHAHCEGGGGCPRICVPRHRHRYKQTHRHWQTRVLTARVGEGAHAAQAAAVMVHIMVMMCKELRVCGSNAVGRKGCVSCPLPEVGS